jgi:predicted regulator of Ras-like GTPase activity (Roadblock/LC7/MglB family)
MSFQSILQSIVADGKGVLGAALMETDGIPIVQVQGSRDVLETEIGSAGVEFGRIIGEIAKAGDALGGGPVVETVVTLKRFTLIFHLVEDDMLLVVALAPEGNLGQVRYLIRRNLVAIRQEL